MLIRLARRAHWSSVVIAMFSLLIAGLAAVVVLVLGQLDSANAANPDAAMQVVVSSGDIPCGGIVHEAGEACVPLGGAFTVVIETTDAPENGYVGVVSRLDYGTLIYNATSQFNEFVWPDCYHFSTGGINWSTTQIGHFCLTGSIPPLPTSTYVGEILSLSFTCPDIDSSSRLRLIVASEEPPTLPLPTTLSGTQLLEGFSGEEVDVPKVNDQLVNCGAGGPPTPTPSPTLTPTFTPTPAPVGGVALDAGLAVSADDGSGSESAWWLVAGLATLALGGTFAVASRLRSRD